MIGAVLRMALLPVVLLVSAGTARWWEAWAVTAVYGLWAVALAADLSRRDPELLRERLGSREAAVGQPGWDRRVLLAMIVAGVALLLVPGLGHRFGWLRLPVAAEVVALAAHLPAFAWIVAVMRANTFLAREVKIDERRGQQVITTGPYAVVRHPLYLGVLALAFATPIALGSVHALVPAAVLAGLLALRTGLEDRMLHAELPGYAAYATKTRSRLLPGIW